MTDIHSHIINEIDDGSRSIEESIDLLKAMANVGFTDVVATPHYIEGSEYAADNKTKLAKLNKIKKELKKQGVEINLYLGNEVFINSHMVENIEKGNIYTINNSKYILFELPFHDQILNLNDIIYELKIDGYIPILAHPERYTYYWKKPKLYDELKENGLLFQANFSSIIGCYGKHSQKMLKYLLKKGYIDYLATDIHHITNTSTLDNFDLIKKKIVKIIGINEWKRILNNSNLLIKKEN